MVIQFTDGTRIHVGIEPVLRVQAEIGIFRDGNLQGIETYPPVLGAPVP